MLVVAGGFHHCQLVEENFRWLKSGPVSLIASAIWGLLISIKNKQTFLCLSYAAVLSYFTKINRSQEGSDEWKALILGLLGEKPPDQAPVSTMAVHIRKMIESSKVREANWLVGSIFSHEEPFAQIRRWLVVIFPKDAVVQKQQSIESSPCHCLYPPQTNSLKIGLNTPKGRRIILNNYPFFPRKNVEKLRELFGSYLLPGI